MRSSCALLAWLSGGPFIYFIMPGKLNESPEKTGSRLSDPKLIIVSAQEEELILARRAASGHPPEVFDAPAPVMEQLFPIFLNSYRVAVIEQVTERTVATVGLLAVEGMIRKIEGAA
jgi:hypothetical protein